MMRKALYLLALSTLCTISALHAASERSLESLQKIWTSEIARIDAEYSSRTKAWPTSYTRELHALRTRMQQSGDLDGYVVVNDELERFLRGNSLSEEDITESISALNAIQQRYLKIYQELTTEKSEDILILKGLYFRHLRSLQVELTKAARIPDAMKVRSEIERIEASDMVSDAEMAMLDSSEVEEIPAAATEVAVVAPAGGSEAISADDQIKEWLALRSQSIAAVEAFYASARTKADKFTMQQSTRPWNQVSAKCYILLAQIKPTDSESVKQTKQDYTKAAQLYWKAGRTFATMEKKTDEARKAKEAMKVANQELRDQRARLEQALGLNSPVKPKK